MLVLETSYGVFKTSASTPSSRSQLINVPIGFFLGAGGSHSSQGGDDPANKPSSVYSGTSGALSVLSGRVSFALGLTGPCLTVDTACSSSLVAAHLSVSACRLLECPKAVATGAGVLTGGVTAAFSAAGMLSALGRSHTFDLRADGYC